MSEDAFSWKQAEEREKNPILESKVALLHVILFKKIWYLCKPRLLVPMAKVEQTELFCEIPSEAKFS